MINDDKPLACDATAIRGDGGGKALTVNKLYIAWIDILKGLAIFLVVMGHFSYANGTGGIKTAIYGFHMPLFFMLAGCTAAISFKRSASSAHFWLKRCKSVLLPYTVWSFLWGIPYCSEESLQHYSFKAHLHTFVCGDVMQWFLICLFVLQTIYALYKYLTKNRGAIFRFLTVFLLFSALFILHRAWGRTSDQVPYWTLEFLTNAYIFYIPFAIGVCIIEHPDFFKSIFLNKFAIFISILVLLFGIRLYATVSILPGNYSKIFTGVCVSLVLIKLISQCDITKIANSFLKNIVKTIILWGKYSLVIYLFHGSLLPNEPLSPSVWGTGILPFMIMVVIGLAVCYICVAIDYIISLSPLCSLFLLGKQQRKT